MESAAAVCTAMAGSIFKDNYFEIQNILQPKEFEPYE